jgi:hypothetical protein
MFLRISETVRAAQFAGFVDVNREPARYTFSADLKTIDLGTAPRLTLPGRGNPPICFTFCDVTLDAIEQGEQFVDIDTIDDFRFCDLRLSSHDRSPLSIGR